MFPKDVKIHGDMNIVWLKTPIGTDEFLHEQMKIKAQELKETIIKISKMPFKMEAFTLMRNCLTQCKVTHLMRTTPPKQIKGFLTNYDNSLRQGFEELIDIELEDKWWWQARLVSK